MGIKAQTLAAVLVGLGCAANTMNAQTLLWSDEFNDATINQDNWTFNVGGSGFGNGELQYYTARPENAYIESGNLVIEARRENYLGDKAFTSARLITNGRMAFKYGTLEARIKLPNVDNGLWPAFWLLGKSIGQLDWPACGEIDIMEVGIRDGFLAGMVNRRIVSAAHWDYQDDYAGYSDYTDFATDLYLDYHLFSVEWTPEHIKTFVDGYNFWTIDITDIEGNSLEEFHEPMYIITNLAVGGWNFIEITDPGAITATFPAKMYIDYIRLYDNGDTEIHYGDDSAETGDFGIFTETTPVNNSVQYDTDASLYLWNNLAPTTDDPYEGEELWSMTAAAGTWFGMGVLSHFDRNMRDYSDGHLHLHMKTSSTDTFKVGIKSSTSGESWVQFVDGEESFGLQRDGAWHEVVVPLNSFLNVDFATVSQLFMIAGDPPTSSFQFAIDNMYWTPSVPRPTPENGTFGILTENPAHNTAGEYQLGIDGQFYIWSDTLQPGTQDPYEGTTSMSFYSTPGLTWFGAAFTPTIKYNLTAFRYPESKLHLALKTSSMTTFRLGMRSGNVDDIGQKWIEFSNGNDPYGFVRDGQWHIVEIPMADISDAVDLSQVSMLFELLGVNGPISDIEFDDICLLGGGDALDAGAGYPTADAGEDQTLVLPQNSTTLRASNSHDDGTIVAFLWEQVNGPATATMAGQYSAVLSVSDLLQGQYVFRITVTDDDDLTDSDTVTVTVTTPNPTADAGPDQTVALPDNSATLVGSGSDADGLIVAYQWTQVSGPTTASLIDDDSSTAIAAGLYEGTYIFELTVTDNDDLTDSDQVTVEVISTPVNIALGKPSSASSSSGSSLVANGGFEAGTGMNADSWSLLELPMGSSTASAIRDSAVPYGGSWHLSLSVAGAADGGPAAEAQHLSPTDSVIPGSEYDLQVMIRRVGDFGPGVVAQIAVQWLDSDGSHGGGVKGSTGFTNIQDGITEDYSAFGFDDLVAPTGSDAALVLLRLAGGAMSGSDGQIACDDVSLVSGTNITDYAVDGDIETRWDSADGDPQWIEVALSDRYEISQVVLEWADEYAQEYDIDVSDNGTDWVNVYVTTNGLGGTETVNLVAVGRYIRLYSHIGNTVNGCSLYEFEVYGRLQPGDINGDSNVDLEDLALLVDCLTGPAVEVAPSCIIADLTRDAKVDLHDYAKLQAAFEPPL